MQHWLRRLLGGKPSPDIAVEPKADREDPASQAREYLARVQAKIGRLAEEFASGAINRSQFQELFEHYQNEKRTIEAWIENSPDSPAWRQAAKEGESVIIRSHHSATVLGYAVYENDSGMPLNTIGRFEVDPALAVPMLSSYRSAAREIFGAGLQSTQIEGGRWMCFLGGEYTTVLALFSTEPAARQLESLEELHRLFEQANRPLLQTPPIRAETLVFPHAYYLGRGD